MNNLNRALVDIRSIRRQVAQSSEFQGYGPFTLCATVLLALMAGVAQARWIPEPTTHPAQYVILWLTTAILSAAVVSTEMLTRANRLHSGMADEMVLLAVTQFLPASVAGTAIPFVLLKFSPGVFWMLPGLWQIIFSLGVFASCRWLPRPMYLVGAWFLIIGFVCIALGPQHSLDAVVMPFAFAVGVSLIAVIQVLSTASQHSSEDEEL